MEASSEAVAVHVRRALVTDDDEAEAHSWWACITVCGAMTRMHEPLHAASPEAAAQLVADKARGTNS